MLEKIDADLLAAMKSGESLKRDTLRMLKSALKNFQIEKGSELTDEETVSVIQKEVKRRKESIVAYEAAQKPDLVAAEQEEMAILSTYLPKQMSDEEIRQEVTSYLEEHPTAPDKAGQAMGALSARLKGKADMGKVSQILRESL